MTIQLHIKAPWRLHFDRDGTEDYGIILDSNGDEIVASHLPERQQGYGNVFWLPETDTDPLPVAVRQMRLMTAAPELLAALTAIREEIELLSGWWTERLATLAQMADAAIAEAEGGRS